MHAVLMWSDPTAPPPHEKYLNVVMEHYISAQVQLSRSGVEGTVEYCAPEVLRGEPFTEKCDIWSFGVVLWELLERRRPYADAEVPHFLLMIRVGRGDLRLSPVDPDNATPGLAALMQRCFSEDPDQRPSFLELLSLLEAEHHALRARAAGEGQQGQGSSCGGETLVV